LRAEAGRGPTRPYEPLDLLERHLDWPGRGVSGGSVDIRFFFELDRGTETHGQLRVKLSRYAEVALLPDVPRTLLFAFRQNAERWKPEGFFTSPA
jgi:hypothetical protein